MKERAEQMFWVHTRGLIETLSPDATANISQAINRGEEIPKKESTRLQIMINDPILTKRHPLPKNGEIFMSQVDYSRRDSLLPLAQELSSHIVGLWQTINPSKEIAVLLYGSIARGLVKKADNPSPSDIDLTVIGDFTEKERVELRNRAQEKREEIKSRILEDCTNVTDDAWADIRYAGTLVQNIEKLTKNNFSDAIQYVASGTQALYDPSGIWAKIENEAIEAYRKRKACSARKTHLQKPITTLSGKTGSKKSASHQHRSKVAILA